MATSMEELVKVANIDTSPSEEGAFAIYYSIKAIREHFSESLILSDEERNEILRLVNELAKTAQEERAETMVKEVESLLTTT